MKAKVFTTLFITLMLFLNTSFADNASLPTVTFADPGLISVTFESKPESGYVLMVKANGQDVVYPLINVNDAFPCQLGNGAYTATVLKRFKGNEYTPLNSWTYQLNDSPNALYLQSIQNIHWSKEDAYIQSYLPLFKKSSSSKLFIKAVHDDMVKHFEYDYNKANELNGPYIPDNSRLAKSKIGICYDFSSYFAAVMRAYGTPCKLVKGYREGIDSYHAWNEVYDGNNWLVVDISYDVNMKELNQPYGVYQDSSNYNMVHEY